MAVSGFTLMLFGGEYEGSAVDARFAVNQSTAALSILLVALVSGFLLLTRLARIGLLACAFTLTTPIAATLATIEVNPWKYWLAWPVSLLVLILAGRRDVLSSAGHIGLISVCLANDYRSAAAVTTASLMLLWFRRPIVRGIQAFRVARPVGKVGYLFGLLIAGACTTYVVLSAYLSLALSGSLGQSIQLKQAAQADTVGGIVYGGRAESSATLDFFSHQFYGYGLGVIPKWPVLQSAFEAIVRNGGTVQQGDLVLATDSLHLHSIAGELWYSFGIPGLVAGGLIAWVAIRMIGIGLRQPSTLPGPLVSFMGVWLLWDLLFSPLESNWAQTGVAIGVCLALSGKMARQSAADESPLAASGHGPQSRARRL